MNIGATVTECPGIVMAFPNTATSSSKSEVCVATFGEAIQRVVMKIWLYKD
jgi:hypothetical protein